MKKELFWKNMKGSDKKFKILSHRADLKLKVFGRDIKEIFLNSMRGMFEATSTKIKGNKVKREIKVQTEGGYEDLLVDFLSEILWLSETYHEAYQDLSFKKFEKNLIEAEIFGGKIKSQQLAIKGVTYHDLSIRQKKDGSFEATILFDI